MKKLTLLLLCSLVFFTGCGQPQEQASDTPERYACPMLCVITDQPGDCPVCGMEMAPVQDSATERQDLIELSESDIDLSGIRTETVVEAKPTLELPMFGKIIPDETKTAVISAWVDGRIDQLFADTTGEQVQQDEALAEFYSPELISAQQELILAAEQPDSNLLNSVRQKLLRLGIREKQIQEIEQLDQPKQHMTIAAPVSGTILERNITEGQYVKRGQMLYRIADLSTVWGELQAYEPDLPYLRAGQSVTLKESGLQGTVEFIDPAINPKTQTAGVRISIPNPDGTLRPEQLIRGTIHATGEHPAVLIPESAPLLTGNQALVYIQATDTIFEARRITLGPKAGDQYVVSEGVYPGEEIVVNGAFRLDAAMQISGRPSMMNTEPAEQEAAPAMHHNH